VIRQTNWWRLGGKKPSLYRNSDGCLPQKVNGWLPKPLPGAEWQLDARLNVADELLRDPGLKSVLKAALEKGAEVVTRKD
jgi:hypothetical protein